MRLRNSEEKELNSQEEEIDVLRSIFSSSIKLWVLCQEREGETESRLDCLIRLGRLLLRRYASPTVLHPSRRSAGLQVGADFGEN